MYNNKDNADKLISSISLLWSTEIKYQISVCCLAWIKHIAMILQQKVVGVGFTNYLFLKEAYTHKYKSYRYNCEIFMACSWWQRMSTYQIIMVFQLSMLCLFCCERIWVPSFCMTFRKKNELQWHISWKRHLFKFIYYSTFR